MFAKWTKSEQMSEVGALPFKSIIFGASRKVLKVLNRLFKNLLKYEAFSKKLQNFHISPVLLAHSHRGVHQMNQICSIRSSPYEIDHFRSITNSFESFEQTLQKPSTVDRCICNGWVELSRTHIIHTLTITPLLVMNPSKKGWIIIACTQVWFFYYYLLCEEPRIVWWPRTRFLKVFDVYGLLGKETKQHCTMDFKWAMTSQYPLPSGLNCKLLIL